MSQPNKRDELLDEILIETWECGFNSNGDFPTERRSRYEIVTEYRQQLNSLIDAAVVEARIDELRGCQIIEGNHKGNIMASEWMVEERIKKLQATQPKELRADER